MLGRTELVGIVATKERRIETVREEDGTWIQDCGGEVLVRAEAHVRMRVGENSNGWGACG